MAASRIPAAVVREVHARSEGICEAMIAHTCGWRAEHLHHRKMRSQGGGHTTEALLNVCAACHTHIHMNTAESYERGLLVRGWDTPTWPPIFYRGRRTNNGTDQNH